MKPPAELISRIFGKTKFFTLYYGEPAQEPRSIRLLDSLESRQYRRLDKEIRHEPFLGAKPVLLLNCNLRLPAGLSSKDFKDFLARLEHPTFSHKVCHTTAEMNQEIYRLMTASLGRHVGYVANQPGVSLCTFYPVKRGDRLVVAHFAI